MKLRSAFTPLLLASMLAGCVTTDKFVAKDFHEPALLEKVTIVEAKASFASGLTGGPVEATGTLSNSGSLKFIYDTGGRSSGENAYRKVKVSSDAAPNLRWEVWARTDSALSMGDRSYAKIMGPFKNKEEAKVDFVNNGIGQSIERNVMILVYSPTETGRKVKFEMSGVTR